MRRSFFLRPSWIIALTALLAGCKVQAPSYPTYWPAQRSQWFGCPDVSGTYAFKGEYEFYNGEVSKEYGLFAFLPMGINSDIESATRFHPTTEKGSVSHLTLSGKTDENLSITVRSKNTIVFSGKLSDFGQNIHCSGGKLRFKRDKYQNELEISRAIDGSLIVKNGGLDCIVPFIPICNYKVSWGRWLAANETAEKKIFRLNDCRAESFSLRHLYIELMQWA